jgi:hypothetical protein
MLQRAAAWGWVFCLTVAGCSSNPTPPAGATVTGKVVKGGSPLTAERLPPGELPAEVVLVPESSSATAERARLQADGTFTTKGAGRGVLPGKYKLAVYHYIKGRGSDGLGGKFSEKNTPITIEIPESKRNGTHDLGTIELDQYAK